MRSAMRVAVALTLMALLAASAGTTATARPQPLGARVAPEAHRVGSRVAQRSGGGARTPIRFVRHHLIDVQRLAGEPAMRIDSKGNIYITGPIGTQYAHSFLWKSEDNGHSFDLLRAFPPLQRPMPSAGSGDAEVVVVPPAEGQKDDAIVWSDMVALASLANAASFDGGNTFPPEYWSEAANDPGADRQWLDWLPGPNGPRIFQWYDRVDTGGNTVLYTDDYGQTWTEGDTNIDNTPSNPGNMAADPVHKKVYVAYSDQTKVKIAVGGIDATGFKPTVVATGVGDVSTLFVTVDTDTAGNVYVSWADRGLPAANKLGGIYMAVSTDQGKTFHKPIKMNPPRIKTGVFPWVVAGDPGRAWVAWYGSEKAAGAADNRGPWNVWASQTLNALSAHPTLRTVKVNDHPMHDNEICLDGIGCTAGQGEDRNLLDDFVAQIDPRGMLHVAYNDTNNQLTASTADPDAGGAFVLHAVQNSGPSLYKRVGNVIPRPAKPRKIATKLKGGVLRVTGRHSLKPGNWARDLRGDAGDPRHGPGCPCANNPSLDMTDSWFVDKGDNVVAHMQFNNLPPESEVITAAGGKTVAYQFVFWVHDRVYFALLEEAGTGRAYAGEPGFIPNQSGIAKIATYDQNPSRTAPIDYTFTPGEDEGGEITMTIPKSLIGSPKKGTRLYRVHPVVQTLEGAIGAETLMQERDGTEARFWHVGDVRIPRGRVQVSIDDRHFRHPKRAHFVKYPSSIWRFALRLKHLSSGKHTLYVRTKASGFTSRPVAVRFTKK